MDFHNLLTKNKHLPSVNIVGSVNEALRNHNTLVITAPPGAGKSTLLPLTMLQEVTGQNKILMLEPRRLAARQIAERMAYNVNEKVGDTVGYRVRFDNCVSEKTRIEVLTEGILTRMLVNDATLDGVDIVVFDEFHERSLNSDLALALIREVQQVLRPDLKIVVMSATIDATSICRSLNAPLIECEGRMFPIDIEYAQKDTEFCDCASSVASVVRQAHARGEGDILVFLPGQGEIMKCMDLLGDTLLPTKVFPLFGNLSPSEQREAIAPSRPGERKIVLSTPIAETSLTIEGVRIVVDSGWCRKLVFDARTGFSHLETVRISMDMARQRAGRAGRVAPGICYRLWTHTLEHRMDTQRVQEIETADLSPLCLNVFAFGERDLTRLPWLTLPPTAHVKQAEQLLLDLGAIDEQRNITPSGKRIASLPCHPRIARMMLEAKTQKLKALAIDIAALLEEKDPVSAENNTDISLRIERLRQHRKDKQLGCFKRIAQIAKEYGRMVRTDEDNGFFPSEDAGLLTAYAFPERVAHAVGAAGHYRLSGGGNVMLDLKDDLAARAWISIASLYAPTEKTGRVFLAAPLDPALLDDSLVKTHDHISWDNKQGTLIAQREKRIGQLVVEAKPLQDIPEEDIIEVVCEAATRHGLSMFSWDEETARLQRRVAGVAAWHPELNLPDISTEHLLQTAKEWLPFYLKKEGRVISSTPDLKRLPLHDIIWNTIPYELQQQIDLLAPTHIVVPTGSRIRLDYRQGAQSPILSVRLQECFGMTDTPLVNAGKMPVLMELLSPGFKPVQLTQDLHSFWKTTYFEVRKDLRRRYPKHYWPENPLEAEAVRGVKRRK